MATYVLKNSKIYLAGFDLSADHSSVTLANDAEAVDNTTFGAGSRTATAGLKTIAADGQGYSQYGANLIEDVLQQKLASVGEVLTVGPETGADGEIGYTFQSLESMYLPVSGAVGEMAGFTLTAVGAGDLIRATIMTTGAKTATANGVARNLGAVGATQKLYAALHVLAVSGGSPTLDLTIQSDDAVGFPSPTTRITFAQQTARGAVWASPVSGSIADTWWRAAFTIAGTTPSFTIAVLVGIQ